jgi:hypothetical protein
MAEIETAGGRSTMVIVWMAKSATQGRNDTPLLFVTCSERGISSVKRTPFVSIDSIPPPRFSLLKPSPTSSHVLQSSSRADITRRILHHRENYP